MFTFKIKQSFDPKEIKQFTKTVYNNFAYRSECGRLKHTQPEIVRLLLSPQLYGVMCYKQQELVGYLVGKMIHLNDGREAFYISYIYVGSKHRSHGLGTRMIGMIYEHAKEELGIGYILVSFMRRNQPAHRYFSRLGFVNDPLIDQNPEKLVMSLFIDR